MQTTVPPLNRYSLGGTQAIALLARPACFSAATAVPAIQEFFRMKYSYNCRLHGIMLENNPAAKNTHFVYHSAYDTGILRFLNSLSDQVFSAIAASLTSLGTANERAACCSVESESISAGPGYDELQDLYPNGRLPQNSAVISSDIATPAANGQSYVPGIDGGGTGSSFSDAMPAYHQAPAGFFFCYRPFMNINRAICFILRALCRMGISRFAGGFKSLQKDLVFSKKSMIIASKYIGHTDVSFARDSVV